MVKIKISHTIDEDLIEWLYSEIKTKRFASISHGIEYALTVVKNQNQTTKTNPTQTTQPEQPGEYDIDREDLRNKWWTDNEIGLSILKQGGIGKTNINNIMQKNPELFETKDESRAWLTNKLKIDPPPEIVKDNNRHKKGIIPNQNHPKILVSSEDPAEPPKFTPNRKTVKCPNCSEEQLIIPGSPAKKCVNCGAKIPEPTDDPKPANNQEAPAQDIPPPPQEAKP